MVLRVLFRLSETVARFSGPDAVVQQYTNRSVSEPVAKAVSDDFHEAFRQGSKATVRETRSFANGSPELGEFTVPVRAWHGSNDENTPLAPVESFIEENDGVMTTSETDHLGTLLDYRRDVLRWVGAE